MGCYLLGLRTLKAILRIAESNLEDLRTYFSHLIQGQRPIATVAELARTTDETLIALTLGCAFGIVKRVSMAVGLKDLADTYSDVLQTLGPTTSTRVIDVAIRLDHFETVPVPQVESLARDVSQNHFTRRVLRDLVANHLYLFKVDYQARQKLGSLLDISSTKAKFLENPDKK